MLVGSFVLLYGPIMVKLGKRYHARGCVRTRNGLARQIALSPQGFYVTINTRKHPLGGRSRRSRRNARGERPMSRVKHIAYVVNDLEESASFFEEVLGFLVAYEDARGAPFDDDERRTWRAAVQRSLAYVSRCRWSDMALRLPVPEDNTFLDLLRDWLESPHAI